MSAFFTAIRSELFLAWRSRGVRALFLIPPIAAFARIALAKAGAAGDAARDALMGGGAETSVELSAFGPFVDGLGAGLTLGFIALAGISAHSIAADRDSGVVRHALVRRVDRTSLVLAKFTFFTFLGLVLVAVVGLASWYSAGMFHEFVAPVEDGFELIEIGEIETELRKGIRLAVLPIPAVVAFGVLVSVCARSSTEAVATTLGLVIVFDLFKSLLGDARDWIWARHVPSLVDESYLGQVALLVRGFSDVFVEERVLNLNAFAPIPEAALLLVLAVWVVRRRRM